MNHWVDNECNLHGEDGSVRRATQAEIDFYARIHELEWQADNACDFILEAMSTLESK